MRGCVIAVGFQQRGPWLLCLLYHTGGWGGGGGGALMSKTPDKLHCCLEALVFLYMFCQLSLVGCIIYRFFFLYQVCCHNSWGQKELYLFCMSVSSTCKVSLRRLVGIFSETAFFQDYEITAILMVSLPAYAVPSCQAKVLVGLVPSPCLAFHILPPSSCPLPVTSLLQHPPPTPRFLFTPSPWSLLSLPLLPLPAFGLSFPTPAPFSMAPPSPAPSFSSSSFSLVKFNTFPFPLFSPCPSYPPPPTFTILKKFTMHQIQTVLMLSVVLLTVAVALSVLLLSWQ